MDREQGIKLMQDLLRRVVEKKASDLFITAGFPPAIKIDGEVRPQSERALTARAVRGAGALHHERPPDQGIRRDQGMQFRDRAAGHRPLPRERLRAAGQHRLRDPPHQLQDPDARGARPAAGPQGSRAVEARPRDPGRRHGLGQVDLAGRDGRLPQREDARPHRHHRRSGGVRAPAQGLRDHAPRSGRRHRQLACRAEEHPAPGARRHPHRRNPRPRDHGIRHPVRRNRPPGAGDAARQQLQPGAGPHHQLLPGRAARAAADGPVAEHPRAGLAAPDSARIRLAAASRRWRSC